jgi:hypothetical protein
VHARRLPTALTVVAVTGLLLTGCSTGTSATPSTPRAAGSPVSSPVSSQAPAVSGQPRTTTAPWDRPLNQAAQVTAAHLQLTATEQLTVHYHSHLTVLVDGQTVPVPANLGINGVDNSGQPVPHNTPGISPLHTHDTSGVLHIEAAARNTFTLGQLFTLWNVRLDATDLGAYGPADGKKLTVFVNGHRRAGDPSSIVLSEHEEIGLVVADPPAAVTAPPAFDWSAHS